MCGLVGYYDLYQRERAARDLIERMTRALEHRGPDSAGYFVEGAVGLGFRRLSIVDPSGGDQPLSNEDGSLILLCNGEIYNYPELRAALMQRGHTLRTNSDVEVLLHLYEDEGLDLLGKLNGQFAFVIYDRRRQRLLLARDHFGVNPLHYTIVDGVLIFASEIKAILEHPRVRRAVDLTGLDQLLSFPGLVSPRTMFQNIKSLSAGHCIVVEEGQVSVSEYWDLDYPKVGDIGYDRPEDFYVEQLREKLAASVRRRLQADVPVGFYLSGGLDSSLIAALIRQASPEVQRHSFSIGFADRQIDESKYQRLMARMAGSIHHELRFEWPDIAARLRAMVYHCECPVKETYNTCSMALAETARRAGIAVILTGEGADELFAGYIGYRFDQAGLRAAQRYDLDSILEEELREKLWGDKHLFYEVDQHPLREVKAALYSERVNEQYAEFDCLRHGVVNSSRLRDRHPLHQRSYLDFKLRLADHLLSDHGDRMALAHAVEARYPFLDVELVEFARCIPPDLKLRQLSEKYVLKRAAEGLIPAPIINREKFGFRAPGSPYLLQQSSEWIADLLSYERIKRQGYFNPAVVERLKAQYSQPGFELHPHLDLDLLLIVLTFGIFLDAFGMPDLA